LGCFFSFFFLFFFFWGGFFFFFFFVFCLGGGGGGGPPPPRDSFFQPVYAHTSPVYVTAGRRALEHAQAAAYFDRAIDDALEYVNHKAKFRNDTQRREVIMLFKEGQAIYRKSSLLHRAI
jgi:hypothetical protein